MSPAQVRVKRLTSKYTLKTPGNLSIAQWCGSTCGLVEALETNASVHLDRSRPIEVWLGLDPEDCTGL